MPTSAEVGKNWMAEQILDINPVGRVYDVGAGCGTYARMMRSLGVHPWELTGVEIWEPYVAAYGLESLYNRLVLADARTVAWQACELAIAGDVVEHMTREDGVALVRALLHAANEVLVSLPIVPWEQGCVDGNEHEAHLHHWSHDEFMAEFGDAVVGSYVESPIGCYRLRCS